MPLKRWNRGEMSNRFNKIFNNKRQMNKKDDFKLLAFFIALWYLIKRHGIQVIINLIVYLTNWLQNKKEREASSREWNICLCVIAV